MLLSMKIYNAVQLAPTKNKYLIDVEVYTKLPKNITTNHDSRSNNYIGFVSFSNTHTGRMNWNIKPALDFKFKNDYLEALIDIDEYKHKNENYIIKEAEILFRQKYPNLI